MADELKRRIGLWVLVAYGVGVMVGAGIYVLTGAVAGLAGVWAPLAFVLAGLVAAPTALSYAEFSTRLPEAAGEAAFVARGFGRDWVGVAVGLMIVATGVISAAAVLRGGTGYLLGVVELPFGVTAVALGLVLTGVAVMGVLESLALAAVFTVIEVCGLALVVWAGAGAVPVEHVAGPVPVGGIAAAAVLAFFAFIGFEDIVNMAEEVREPERIMPRAILISLAVTSVLYALVVWAAVRAVPLAELGASEQPLALVWERARGGEARFLSGIAVFAALNGVLAQIVMASRVLFGLGKRSRGLAVFHHAHPRFGTPVLATAVVGGAVIVAALALPVAVLAGLTSSVLLVVFVLVNTALIAVKRSGARARFEVPMGVPVAGLGLSLLALSLSIFG
ncbi:APC family permease [Tropicibacter naphthalenivorans]|uniref:Putative amino acid permease YhdG n=1 Tax=Tropicibacter naphthalenivorans TaxID=441103 RepID=A0A0P1G2R1_9RHOB|nr:APC family permease [Tropicibacter naphthalenivorans]CUH76094.1 putative amino acid permease YhdG [Tropicibacter naphthalenivorans]SMC40095.1 amino acid/polyamine/organocation transporter, APC superfamily [Tropicibacter naphthalenivorans]